MNDYIDKLCPFCKTKFEATDEIIVCSNCDMPHHKECWIENQGCTTFGCLGTINTADDFPTSVTSNQINYDTSRNVITDNVIFCTECGEQNEVSSSFCFNCGNKLTENFMQQSFPLNTPVNATYNSFYSIQQANYNSNGYNNYQSYYNTNIDIDIQQLVETNTSFYIPKFQDLKSKNNPVSWNWPAFLITPYWMIYRKMYVFGACVLGISFILSLFDSIFLSLLMTGGNVALGLFSNNIYMKVLEYKSNQVKTMTEPYRTQFIMRNRGTNATATGLTIIGYSLLLFIIFLCKEVI